LVRGFKFALNPRFFGQETIGNESRQQICQKVDKTSMSGMFDLTDIFQFITHRFNQGSFPEKDFIGHIHRGVFYILSNFSNQMNSTDEECIKEGLRNIAFIAKEFTPDLLQHLSSN